MWEDSGPFISAYFPLQLTAFEGWCIGTYCAPVVAEDTLHLRAGFTNKYSSQWCFIGGVFGRQILSLANNRSAVVMLISPTFNSNLHFLEQHIQRNGCVLGSLTVSGPCVNLLIQEGCFYQTSTEIPTSSCECFFELANISFFIVAHLWWIPSWFVCLRGWFIFSWHFSSSIYHKVSSYLTF